jgi:hypothetical protein
MKWVWGLLLLFACTAEYGIESVKGGPDVVVDTATYETTTPATPTTAPEPPDDVDFAPRILVEPLDYDFGELLINCHDEYDLTISSIGTAPLVIDELLYFNTPELSMDTTVNLPLTLAPGEELVITFSYDEEDLHNDVGTLYIFSNAEGKSEQKATHEGVGIPHGTHTDVFEQEEIRKSDILFVIDNSCSMSQEQDLMSENMETFVEKLVLSEVDFQAAVITTDDISPVGGVMSGDDFDVVSQLAAAVDVGNGGGSTEIGQQMAMEAIDINGTLSPGKFVREDAFLSIVIVSDEDDASPLTDVEYYDFFMTIKDPDMFAWHSVVGTGVLPPDPAICNPSATGYRYMDQSLYTYGVVLDICADWGDSLTVLAESSYRIEDTYLLTRDAIPTSIKVSVDGVELTEGWVYNEISNVVYLEDRTLITGDELFQITYDYIEDCVE